MLSAYELHALSMQQFPISFTRLGLGISPNLQKVVHRHDLFYPLGVGFLFFALDSQPDQVLAVSLFFCDRLDGFILKERDFLEEIGNEIPQLLGSLFSQPIDQCISVRVRWALVSVLFDDLLQGGIDPLLTDHLSKVVQG